MMIAAVAALALTGCASTTQQMDDSWEQFSARERENACQVFASQGTEAFVDAALRGNESLTRSEAREWVESNLPRLCD